MILIPIINGFVFLVLSGLHFYWAMGGKFGFAESLPKKSSGEQIMNPTKFHCAIVGLGLLACSAYYYIKLGWMPVPLSKSFFVIGWIITVIFLLRAVGDFRYVGFFKKIKDTDFGRQDSRYYSPLCLVLALNGALVEIVTIKIV